ncbi:hypothetical protein C8Q80DRAFT_1114587 [Daedaleopsis nitida]|nr:hypothetical protein C8Q80DRAFT_1114587 [Daedaleopsis nitida]
MTPQSERRVRFEDEERYYRARRPSWHGGLAPPPNPVPFPSPPIIRRRSDTCLPQPAWVTFPTMVQSVAFQSPPSPIPQIHPLLNGENAAGPKILFDLSFHTFNPQRITSYSQTSGTPVTLEELLEPATHPPVYHMRIVCEQLPDWPIVLEPHTTARERERESSSPFLSARVPARAADEAPITVYDVLMAVHRTVQRRIAQTDWVRLTRRQTNAISAAYTRRCRTYPSAQAFEEAQGVRRVDYLFDQYMFRGIMRENAQDGFARMKLLVGPAR